jgi:hypothetical protein
MKLSDGQQGKIIFTLIQLYQHLGEYQKALALADNQTPIFLCREVLLTQATIGEEKELYQGDFSLL